MIGSTKVINYLHSQYISIACGYGVIFARLGKDINKNFLKIELIGSLTQYFSFQAKQLSYNKAYISMGGDLT